MLYLAEHPLGKTSKSSTSDAAQILVHLPKRAAFVQCGEDIGVIYTHKTPARLDGQSLAARRLFVREQTRQAYCHPREQFEQHVVSESTTDPNTFSRWEDVEEGTEGKEVSEGVEANEP